LIPFDLSSGFGNIKRPRPGRKNEISAAGIHAFVGIAPAPGMPIAAIGSGP
jgi:murein DD-endopeptidase MepM/ murein hydrolase activator NlpD